MHLAPFRTYPGRVAFVRQTIGGKPLKFLDVGNLGDGHSTNTLNMDMVQAAGGTYVGLDSNAELTKRLALPNQHVGNIHHTEFPDDTFDVVYLGEVIEHTWEPGKMVAECWRILKPGGRIVLDTPNPYALNCFLRYVFRRRDSMGDIRKLTYHEARYAFGKLRDAGEDLLQPQHKIFFTPAMLKQILETHGFLWTSLGYTRKYPNLFTRLALALFPQLGQHLCVVGTKASVDEAFADVSNT